MRLAPWSLARVRSSFPLVEDRDLPERLPSWTLGTPRLVAARVVGHAVHPGDERREIGVDRPGDDIGYVVEWSDPDDVERIA
jgi:hypothetical protein